MTQKTEDTLSRKEREALRRRAEILEAAEQVFSERGYHAASMEEVAKRAEFAVGSLYNVFRNKEDLYVAMLHQKVEEFEPQLLAALDSGGTPLEGIRNFFHKRLDLFWENPRFSRIYYHESMGTQFDNRAGFTPEVMARYERFIVKLRTKFEDASRAGEVAPGNSGMMILILEGALHHYVLSMLRNGITERNRQNEADLFALLLRGFNGNPRLD